MNQKKAKAIRRALNANLVQYGLTVKAAITEQVLVRSQRGYRVTVTEGDEKKEYKDHAIQVRLKAGSPRQVYQKVKEHVSGNRG